MIKFVNDIVKWFTNKDLDEMFQRSEINFYTYQKLSMTRLELQVASVLTILVMLASAFILGVKYSSFFTTCYFF